MKAGTETVMAVLILALCCTCFADELYVPGQYWTIQSAIDDSNDGDIIIVADGTYTGNGNRDIDFLGKAITVRSTDPNDPNTVEATIINCQGSDSDRHRGFKFFSNEGPNSVLSGLTITNGYGPYEEGYSSGGGIYCIDASPTISNCIIKNNTADYGSGLEIDGNSSPEVNNCSFVGNRAHVSGGGLYCWYSSPTITDCTFEDNLAAGTGGATKRGGGVTIYKASPTFISCALTNNTATDWGGCIECRSSNAEFIRCSITNNLDKINEGCVDGGYFESSNIVIRDCLISETKGESLYFILSDATITNCTVTNNKDSHAAGGIYQLSGLLEVNNCIVWANKGSNAFKRLDIFNGLGDTEISYSDIIKTRTGGDGTFIWKEGNIEADPCFVEPGYWDVNGVWVEGDYHLLRNSPCIDAGDPNFVPEPNETDIDGHPRVMGNGVDIGADESVDGLEVWPAHLEFTAYEGCSKPKKVLSILSTLDWEITQDCDFVAADLSSGDSTGEVDDIGVNVAVDVACLGEGIHCCNMIVSDTNALDSPQTVTVNVNILANCISKSQNHPDYNDWLSVGKPECWCNPRQCHGDADNFYEDDQNPGYFWVGLWDLKILVDGWKQPYSGSPALDGPDPGSDPDTWICADFTHEAAGDPKQGYFRVYGDDLNVLIRNWKSNPPPDCP